MLLLVDTFDVFGHDINDGRFEVELVIFAEVIEEILSLVGNPIYGRYERLGIDPDQTVLLVSFELGEPFLEDDGKEMFSVQDGYGQGKNKEVLEDYYYYSFIEFFWDVLIDKNTCFLSPKSSWSC